MDEVNKKVYAVALIATVMTLIVGLAIALCSILNNFGKVFRNTKKIPVSGLYIVKGDIG